MRNLVLFFFNDTATTEIYTLSLHDALPISSQIAVMSAVSVRSTPSRVTIFSPALARQSWGEDRDRKSTRLNSSHLVISYAVFCLKKKRQKQRLRINLVPSLGKTLSYAACLY